MSYIIEKKSISMFNKFDIHLYDHHHPFKISDY